jgi:hypothetical protein
MRITLFLAPVVLMFGAESGSLNGPAPALVFDAASKAVRPMIGIAGSSYLGGAIASEVDAVVASPDGKAAAYLKGGSLYMLQNGSSVLLAQNVDGPLAWAADSGTIATAGVLFGTDGSSTPLARSGGTINALAAAKHHAVAAAEGGVWLLTADSARQIASADKPVSVSIQGSNLYFADSARGEVWLLRDYVNGGEPVLVAKAEGAMGVDAEGSLVLISAGRKVIGLRSSSFNPVFELELDFDASSLTRLNRSTWLLNAGQTGPLQVLSLDGDPAVYFVPRSEEAN